MQYNCPQMIQTCYRAKRMIFLLKQRFTVVAYASEIGQVFRSATFMLRLRTTTEYTIHDNHKSYSFSRGLNKYEYFVSCFCGFIYSPVYFRTHQKESEYQC